MKAKCKNDTRRYVNVRVYDDDDDITTAFREAIASGVVGEISPAGSVRSAGHVFDLATTCPSVSQLFLCLSRTCLGKLIICDGRICALLRRCDWSPIRLTGQRMGSRGKCAEICWRLAPPRRWTAVAVAAVVVVWLFRSRSRNLTRGAKRRQMPMRFQPPFLRNCVQF